MIHQSRSSKFKTIFISDFHIGAKSFNAPALLDFLKKNESEKLYLVGDIIDGWKLNKRWYWSETINQIFDELIRKVAEGTEVIYVPGNHDDAIRSIPILKRIGFEKRMGIKISDKIIHRTQSGKQFLVMHGDQFDTRLLSEPVLKTHHAISDWLGDLLSFIKPAQPMIEINGKMKKFSLAKYLSKHGRLAIQTLNDFEGMVYRLVKAKKLDGIICGHTHIPVLKSIKDITYANTGSWLRNGNTALIEDDAGDLSLLEWAYEHPENRKQMPLPFAQADIAHIELRPASYAYRPVTDYLVRQIYRIWGPAKLDHSALNILQDYKDFYRSRLTPAKLDVFGSILPENLNLSPLHLLSTPAKHY